MTVRMVTKEGKGQQFEVRSVEPGPDFVLHLIQKVEESRRHQVALFFTESEKNMVHFLASRYLMGCVGSPDRRRGDVPASPVGKKP